MSVDEDDYGSKEIAVGKEVWKLLAPLSPGNQIAVLADLTAMWIAGWPITKQDRLLVAHIRGIRKLIQIYRRVPDDDVSRN